LERYEKDSDWQDVSERLHGIERLLEKTQDIVEHLDKEWESLVVQRARIEERIDSE
jgi:hypothetical protein